MTNHDEPRLPTPYAESPNESEAEQTAWEAAIDIFVTNLVLYKLSVETTPADLFALFDASEHQPLLFYYACAGLLKATQESSDAAEHISLIAALFGLLKEEGLKRDDSNGSGTFGNTVVFPTLRALAGDIPVPPGYKYDSSTFALRRNPEYTNQSPELSEFAEYARKHQGQLRLWSLVGRLEADGLLGSEKPGTMSLLFHQGSVLLQALEDSANRGVWETLWAAILHCDEEMGYGEWGTSDPERLVAFKTAVKEIAGASNAPLEWRARFALILEALEKER
ncbi:hypothetical protein R3P38DRAFT_2595932 [Favolaschia claudopus]|uniref:Uncharacterized protein n=1 Tax=Favolaschia claudopus TaxID=2862362 RepID=A0AAW0EA58_9AGAR